MAEQTNVERTRWAIGVLQDRAAPAGRMIHAQGVLLGIAEAADREQPQGAVDLIRRAEPYVRAARHESGVRAASALADEMAALLPENGGR